MQDAGSVNKILLPTQHTQRSVLAVTRKVLIQVFEIKNSIVKQMLTLIRLVMIILHDSSVVVSQGCIFIS